MTEMSLRYLGGCPGRDRPDTVQIAIEDDRFEVQGHGWGWRIGFDSVQRVGEAQPAPDGEGLLVPVLWQPPEGEERTLMLSGRDAGRLRFLLAQAVATRRFAAERAAEQPAPSPPAPPAGRPAGPWARELRRMRAVTAAALVVALAALVIVFGVAMVVIGSASGGGHWATDRAALARYQDDIRTADARNDTTALTRALQTLVDACERLTTYNGEAANTGNDFAEVQRVCNTAGVTLY